MLILVRSETGEAGQSTESAEEERTETDPDRSEETVKYYRGNKVGELQEYLMSRALGAPSYQEGETTGPPHKQHFTITVSVGDLLETGHGKTKKEAKVGFRNLQLNSIDTSILLLAPGVRGDPGKNYTTTIKLLN